jgi:IgGFc binding protein
MRAFLVVGGIGSLLVAASCGNSGPCKGEFCASLDGGEDTTASFDAADVNIGFADTGTGDSCAQGCSGDLHSVVDCNGNVIMTCPSDQGCAAGMCMPACNAAEANKSSVGCDYYAVPATDYVAETCFAVYVANTWGSPVTLTVGWGTNDYTSTLSTYGYLPTGSGQSITYTPLAGGQVPVNGVGILFLSGNDCPKTTATSSDVSNPGTQVTNAFHITADRPVVLYDIFPYGGGSSAVTSATLLLPTSVWDDNYIATSAWSETGFGNPWIAFVAQQDGTQVSIVPTADITAATGVTGTLQGKLGVYNLNAGQLLRIQQPTDLTGSVVQSNYPLGSWGGHGCTNLETAACDGMHQQIPPVKALGSSYVAVRYRNRLSTFNESPPWRFVGAVDGTTLTYDPPQTGAPMTLSQGELVEWDASGPFVVSSQDANHPFFFGAHMTGCFTLPGNYDSPVGCAGDPEMVNVIPPNQWLESYIFFTDPTYPESNLVFIRKKAPDNTFHDVTLDCSGVLTGWQNVDAAGNYQYTRADVQTGNFSKVGMCDNGRNSAHSDVPFALTVWGWGSIATTQFSQAVSYAYPAGASVQPINTVVIPPTPH